MKQILVTCCLLLGIAAAYAQQNQVRAGNKLYEEKKYKQAANVYQDALKKNPNYLPGIFNLGNALYQDKNYDASRKTYDALEKKATDPRIKASSAYNVGNTYMSQQKWEEAVNAYKQALRKHPQDEDAKYNLSYALAKMKQNQGGGGKNKDQKEDKKEQDKDKDKQQQNKEEQNKDKQDQNKDQKDQEDKQDQKDQQQEQKPQPQSSKLSEKQADQLLNALAQEEKKLHDKKEKGKAVKVKVEKDW